LIHDQKRYGSNPYYMRWWRDEGIGIQEEGSNIMVGIKELNEELLVIM
jgi:hypothetical protein